MRTAEKQDGRRPEARGTARERLLDAAAKVFAEHGYRGASIDDIAASAGVTKGALYWNFPSKQEFFFALLEERVDSRVREFVNVVETADWDDRTARNVSRGLARIVDEERELFLLLNEYWSLAVRDPELRKRYAARKQALREGVARALVARQERMGVSLTIDPDALATGMIALANGLAAERIADRGSVPDDLLGELLERILGA
jgi:AcrR family transcriptional regulator